MWADHGEADVGPTTVELVTMSTRAAPPPCTTPITERNPTPDKFPHFPRVRANGPFARTRPRDLGKRPGRRAWRGVSGGRRRDCAAAVLGGSRRVRRA